MSTKTTNTNTASFDPSSLNAYHQGLSGGMGVLQQDIQNPMSSIGFNQRIQQGNQNLFNTFAQRNQQIGNSAGGWSGGPPGFIQDQLRRNSMSLMGQQSNLFNTNLLYADQLKQNAASQMLNLHPLQTGSTSTQSQSGVGTWLGPLASAGMGALTMGMGGGLLGGGGSTSGAFGLGSVGGPMASQSVNTWGASNASNAGMINQMPTSMNYSNTWLNSGGN